MFELLVEHLIFTIVDTANNYAAARLYLREAVRKVAVNSKASFTLLQTNLLKDTNITEKGHNKSYWIVFTVRRG